MKVDVKNEDGVAVLTMDNGENRMSGPFVDLLHETLDALSGDAEVKAVVVTGAEEKYFSNGLDLAWIVKSPRPSWLPFLVRWEELLHKAFTYPKPLVAAMNGHAFAGGLFFALCADWRVMRKDKGWCCVPEIDLNLNLPPGNTALVAYAAGTKNADRLALSGMRVNAEKAMEMGLVDEVAAKDDVIPQARVAALRLAAKPPLMFTAMKRNIRSGPALLLKEEDPRYLKEMFETEQVFA